jgi:hypothetical protein
MPVAVLSETGDVLLLREHDADHGGGDVVVAIDESDEQEQKGERALRCHQCNAPITTMKERTSRGGQHLHTVFNPAGIVYEIGCFNQAPGCVAPGAASGEFSWFAGYSWRVAFCALCLEHLGWYFSGGEAAFFGLIVNRLKAD